LNIVTIDLGTTNLKISLVNLNEKDYSVSILESINRRLTTYTPTSGSYEHSPTEIKRIITESLQHFSHRYKVDVIIPATYLFAMILMDRELRPKTNILTWLDTRAINYIGFITDKALELYRRTGCPPLHIYTLPKLVWLKHEMPEILRNSLILDAKSLISSWFLGYPITDLSTASGTYQMLNIAMLTWDSLALEIADIDENQLPELREAYYSDTISENIAREFGLEPGTLFILGLYDGASMIYGLSRGRKDVAVVNLGTSAMLRTVIDKPIVDSSPDMRFQTYYMMDRLWLSGGAINNCGIVLEFLLKLLNIELDRLSQILNTEPPNPSQTPLVIPLLHPERLPGLPRDIGFTILKILPNTSQNSLIWGTIEGILMLLKLLDESLHENGIDYTEIAIGGRLSQYIGIRIMTSSIFNKRQGFMKGVEASHLGNILLSIKVIESNKAVDRFIQQYNNAIDYIEPYNILSEKYAEKFLKFKNMLMLLKTLNSAIPKSIEL